MKLLFCPHCEDVRKLTWYRMTEGHRTECGCGKSWGYYRDDINAVYGGDAVMLGIDNRSLVQAINAQQRKDGIVGGFDEALKPIGLSVPRGSVPGTTFKSFIIPESAPTVRRASKEK